MKYKIGSKPKSEKEVLAKARYYKKHKNKKSGTGRSPVATSANNVFESH